MEKRKIQNIELELLLEAINMRYGYDFRNYAKSSLRRRVAHRMALSNMTEIHEMIPKVLYDKDFFNSFLLDMSITVTEMFRDPHFFVSLREQIVPILKTYPYVNIWHAGCATGEEVYSMAILLKEEGFYDRVRIYATDYNEKSLEIAKEGIYPLDKIKSYTGNYIKAGGKTSFSDYYHAKYDSAKMNESLKENITFSHHNLVRDGVFAEMNLIICRNVLIYFDTTLQNKVVKQFSESLCPQGFFCMGTKERLDFTEVNNEFELVSKQERIYRKLIGKSVPVLGTE